MTSSREGWKGSGQGAPINILTIPMGRESMISGGRILAVDDELPHRELLREIFEQPDMEFYEAPNALVALKMLENEEFDLLLLDNNMPGMTGIELCRTLRKSSRYQYLPIILVTAINDPITLSFGLAAGADDFVGKPYSPIELEARVMSHLARSRAQKLLMQYHRRLRTERDLIERLVNRMRGVGHGDNRGFSFIVNSVEDTAGDLVLSTGDEKGGQRILVGDFTGHGLPSAIGSPLVSYIFTSMSRRGASLRESLAEVNSELVQRTPTDLYLAACILEMDPTRRQLTVFNAGMPDLVLVQPGSPPLRLPSRNLPLGILSLKPEEFTTEEFQLQGNESLFIFSDGALDQLSPDGEPFGMDRLIDLCLDHTNEDNPLALMLEQLKSFAKVNIFQDDVTLARLLP